MAGSGVRQCLRNVTVYLLLLVTISTLGPLQFGLHLAELNAPQDVITCRKKSVSIAARLSTWVTSSRPGKNKNPSPGLLPDCIPMNEAAFATISSLFTLGALAGALAAGPLSSKRGRLPAMRATAILYAVGSLIEAVAASVWVMSLGRLISGLGAGASTVIVPLYISEVSPPTERGLFGAMTQVSINVGILFTQILGYFLSYGHEWRWILGAGLCIAAIQATGLLCVPESPRIRGKRSDIQGEVETWGSEGSSPAHAEHEGLLAEADATEPPSHSLTASRTPAHLGFAQICGINSVIMYSVSLFSNMFPTSSTLLTIAISAVNLIMTASCAPLPDRLGRKACLLLSILGQGTSALALAFSVVFGVRILSVIAVLCFVGFFAVGLGPVPFVLASELVGQEAVGATQSWALAANFTATFLVAQFFPIINTALNNALGGHGWAFFLFAALAAGSALFVLLKVPETRGKKDMDEVWGRSRRVD
ncbi:sugar transporter domain-containing protein [Hirsutella rhossiliensis]|uniref:Sugar transporter domain-containing protein n=1 Tax=Hirsutella rhossiliensis TaxID=111463 RepID=A0A9P8MN10_9HYPO|nr:sugar transporter domain-containing protein [Hirsutella rhossiliensis]KAH0958135.1 sugar transporter domain-containing protein [Hirsutella rhossiliensis]